MPTIHTIAISHTLPHDPVTKRLLADAKALGFSEIAEIAYHDLYFIEGELSEKDKQKLTTELFSDPVTQQCSWENNHDSSSKTQIIEVALRPGVTDPVAEQIVRGSQSLGITGIRQAATGQRFSIKSSKPLTEPMLDTLAQQLLANPVIHHYTLGSITHIFPDVKNTTAKVENILLRDLDRDQLLALSQSLRSALDLAEMLAIQNYYQKIHRDPTDIEFEMIAQTWSEHCSHKTFRANIHYNDQIISGLLKTYIRAATEEIAAPWVWSAFVDNAGIIDFDDEYQISFKVETHNHPSAIEPFGGANTGLGGVIRDVLGVSAKPIANTDIFCFGPQNLPVQNLPAGTLHPQRIRAGVIAGVQDYGNKTGIPTVNGAIWYDAGYIANPLVFCGCVGLAPKNSHPRKPLPTDRVIILGGRTGRDGIRGATFSSMTMDAQTGEVAGASVQIGDPLLAKGLIEVVTRARDLKLYHAVTDCGAGGLSSAVGEMASNIGAEVDIAHVRLKYQGLAPWEIWLSEAQERMVLAVPDKNIPALQNLCDTYDLELTDIGQFTATKELLVKYNGAVILQLANEFLFAGMPQKTFIAYTAQPEKIPAKNSLGTDDYAALLLKLLSHPNISSKEDVIRRYDHEVQGGTVIKPLTGVCNDGPSDACVLKPQGTNGLRGIVLANGLNPEFGKFDPYAMAVSVIDEAIRNAVAVGADPQRIAILDNFSWGDPNRPETLGALVEAARGCYDAALHYRTPFISGKDSLNNEYLGSDGKRHAIPPTLLISALGIIPDITKAVSMDFKKAGNIIYLIGHTQLNLLGSHYLLCGGQASALGTIPNLPPQAPSLYKTLHQAMQAQLIHACHDLSEGGLAVAAAEMCIGGRLGCALELLTTTDLTSALFSESNGRFIVEIAPENCDPFETYFTSQQLSPFMTKLGKVTATPVLSITSQTKPMLTVSLEQLITAWQTCL